MAMPIAILVDEGTNVTAFEGFTAADASSDAAKPAPKEEAKEESKSAPTPTPKPKSAPKDTSSSSKLKTTLNRFPNASFSAITLAKEKVINIKDIKGTSKGGKVIEEDVKKAASSPAATTAGPIASYEDIPISGMRKVIASCL
ncbi:Dihydrolipoyllysine-residue acetyltransferase component of pyruvate dehydrogenase complex [Colletotrichum sp. SAR11_59]|nr:Dihydrolipoyllysine-residue acetyltransferase component of pyruvate dehydrogenase complex [Colletotrichum sp. SAR11_59]